jgi:hypothetical protein
VILVTEDGQTKQGTPAVQDACVLAQNDSGPTYEAAGREHPLDDLSALCLPANCG